MVLSSTCVLHFSPVIGLRCHTSSPSSISNMADEGGVTTTTTRKCTCSWCDVLWIVTTKEGWLKLVEAIMTFLTIVILESFPYELDSKSPYKFLVFAATAALILVVLHIILRMTHLFEKLPSALRHPVLGLVGCFLVALCLLIGSAIVYAKGDKYYVSEMEASGICGFISTLLFSCEGIYFVFLYRRATRRRAEEKISREIQADNFARPAKPEYV